MAETVLMRMWARIPGGNTEQIDAALHAAKAVFDAAGTTPWDAAYAAWAREGHMEMIDPAPEELAETPPHPLQVESQMLKLPPLTAEIHRLADVWEDAAVAAREAAGLPSYSEAVKAGREFVEANLEVRPAKEDDDITGPVWEFRVAA